MLVSPINRLEPYTERIIEFKGLNKNAVIEEGELRDMKNMTSDEYPCLYQRKARGIYEMPGGVKKPISLLCKNEKLAMIAEKEVGGYAFYYDGDEQPQVADITETTTMVAINTKICFFPQKTYMSLILDENDEYPVGSLEAFLSESAATIEETTDGQKIVFLNSDIDDLKDFAVGDAINLNCTISIQGTTIDNKPVTVGVVIDAIGEEGETGSEHPYIMIPSESFLELAEEGKTEGTLSDIEIDKGCPDLDFVMEYNNRLWGVSNADNTIYACKLGDPRNWQYFQNTSLDSYYAEQGTDGEWTGLAPYSGHMMFFKENYIHKVYGTSPSTYQIVTATAHGVEKGSSKSVAIINDTVLYKSTLGIMAYEGAAPYLITSKFGSAKFKDVVAGTDGVKYYCSILKEAKNGYEPIMLVCDMQKGVWHKEDALRARDFCLLKNKLIFINSSKDDYFEADKIYIINADNPMDKEKDIKWMVELGPYDEYVENKKIYSKLGMRLELSDNAGLDIFISTDEGEWEQLEHLDNHYSRVAFVPIIPRRCNKFAIRLEGVGNCRIESLSRKFRPGTGGML